VPLFNGFVSKTMVVAAAGELHRPVIHLLLHLASIGTFLHTGLKLPYGVWFGKVAKNQKAEEIQAKEPPLNMLLAMGITAFLCLLTGVYPQVLYNLLPYPVHYNPYTSYHVVGMMQLLLLTAAAFWLYLDKLGGEATISIDTDWFYRKAGKSFIWFCNQPLDKLRTRIQNVFTVEVNFMVGLSKNPFTVPKILFWSFCLYSIKMLSSSIGSRSIGLEKYEHKLKSLQAKAYNEDIYRIPIGWGGILALLFFLLWTIMNLHKIS
jgi:multicomponent Na+:H+ antiporter subunit D